MHGVRMTKGKGGKEGSERPQNRPTKRNNPHVETPHRHRCRHHGLVDGVLEVFGPGFQPLRPAGPPAAHWCGARPYVCLGRPYPLDHADCSKRAVLEGGVGVVGVLAGRLGRIHHAHAAHVWLIRVGGIR